MNITDVRMRRIEGETKMKAVVSITIVAVVIIAKLVGATLPIIAKRIGFDPAVMASPFITTIVDALSLLVYFNMAKLILGATS